MSLTAVIVDDRAGFRAMAGPMLEDAGFEVVAVERSGRVLAPLVASTA